MSLQPLNEHNAPQRARITLANVRKQFGFIPNMLGIMAHAPAVLESYLDLAGKFDSTSLDPTERQVVLLAVSHHNVCDYCVAAHNAIARAHHVDGAVLDALATGEPIADPRLEALRRFAQTLVREQGHPTSDDVNQMLDVGFTESQILEVVLGVAFKTLSNYTNHVTDPAIDKAFGSAA
ncbi:carboxymuconolactone decarboxylase family protein [Planctomycetales bacterium ZRK34]|nr:carboxymuconolactone decarboxylase family protein [Planctomycetales bacterium ZRK34]